MAEAVTVGVRIRPLNQRELKSESPHVAFQTKQHNQVFRAHTTNTSSSVAPHNTYTYDSVFDKHSTNEQVYNELASPIVEAALAGFNATIFAYGQTSSGKTHSMLGYDEDPGITPRAIRQVLESINNSRTRQYIVRVYYVEIYNDRIKDLMNPNSKDLTVREDKAGRTYVDASETPVTTFNEAMKVLETGQNSRQVGETKMNSRSSRSHTVFTLLIESKSINEKQDTVGFRASCLNLVDLAGSERVKSTGATGKRAKEGSHINQSLLVLGTIINRLSAAHPNEKIGHLPYRDSKLTRLLRPALGGNAKTAILCAITPSANHVEETISTLKFAERAKKVTNKIKRHEIIDYKAKYGQLSTENDILREKYNQLQLQFQQLKNDQQNQQSSKHNSMIHPHHQLTSPLPSVVSPSASSPNSLAVSEVSEQVEEDERDRILSSEDEVEEGVAESPIKNNTILSSSVSSLSPRNTRINTNTNPKEIVRKLHSDTDTMIKKEVEIRESKEEIRFLKARVEEVEIENEDFKSRLIVKANEFSSLRLRTIELRSVARQARNYEKQLFRVVKSSYDQLQDAKKQLDTSRKKGAHVLLAENKITALSEQLERYVKLGEQALKQDIQVKHERTIVLRPVPGQLTESSNNRNNKTNSKNQNDNENKDKEMEKAAALALRLGGVTENEVAGFAFRPQKQQLQKNNPVTTKQSTNKNTVNNNNNVNIKLPISTDSDYDDLQMNLKLMENVTTPSKAYSPMSSMSSSSRRRRLRPLPEDMVADIDEDSEDDETLMSKGGARKNGARVSTANWNEIDVDLELDDTDESDLSFGNLEDETVGNTRKSSVKSRNKNKKDKKSKENSNNNIKNSKEQDEEKHKKPYWQQALRSFYGHGQQNNVMDVMVGGHKVNGKSTSGVAR